MTLWTKVTLPSLGHYYGDALLDGQVEITAWTAEQEELLFQSLDGPELIAGLLRHNIRLPSGLSYDDLLVTDHLFVLLRLRCISLTPFFTREITCNRCAHRFSHQINMDTDFNVKVSDGTVAEPFEATLSTGTKVGMVFLRMRDLQVIRATKKQADLVKDRHLSMGGQVVGPSTASASESIMIRARQIQTVNGEPMPFPARLQFVRSLIMRDGLILDALHERVGTGIVPEVSVPCPKCSTVQEVGVSMSPTFFRPLLPDLERAVGLAEGSGADSSVPSPAGVLLD